MAQNDECDRDFIAVPPEKRGIRLRRGSRVLVIADNAVLLEKDIDPGVPGSAWWVLPGGGVDAGETWRQAAARELKEETGLDVDETELVGPIGARTTHHGYSDQILEQEERFFRLQVSRFAIDKSGYTEEEKRTLVDAKWFTRDELAGITVWPAQIGELWDMPENGFLDMGDVEESTVPLTDRQRNF